MNFGKKVCDPYISKIIIKKEKFFEIQKEINAIMNHDLVSKSANICFENL